MQLKQEWAIPLATTGCFFFSEVGSACHRGKVLLPIRVIVGAYESSLDFFFFGSHIYSAVSRSVPGKTALRSASQLSLSRGRLLTSVTGFIFVK
jgi:hypothetical protein